MREKERNKCGKKLNAREYLAVAIMLFGMFFGAGNLIFPVFMGWQAGRNVWGAILGFIVTGVGLPLMGVAAIGISRSDGLVELSGKVSRPYSVFFTCALYLTIGLLCDSALRGDALHRGRLRPYERRERAAGAADLLGGVFCAGSGVFDQARQDPDLCRQNSDPGLFCSSSLCWS